MGCRCDSSGNARYQCPSCERSFDRRDALSRHMKLHDPRRALTKVRRKSCTSCFRSKIKCSGTRPVCSSCAKRGIDCRYAKDNESRPRSDSEDDGSPAQNKPREQQSASNGHDQLNSSVNQSVALPAGFNVADSTEGTALTSLADVGTPISQTLGHSPAIGNSAFYRGQYLYIDDAAGVYPGHNPDWLADGPINNSSFAEPFVPGLWNLLPLSPPQVPQLAIPSPQCSDAHGNVTEDDSGEPEPDTASHFEHPWPMEWNPGSTEHLSLPVLEDFQQYKPIARRTFCTKPIASSEIMTLKDRIRMYYDHGPWQPIDFENFPSGESLTHAIDMYFVHFHPILPMVHHPTFDPEKDIVITLCLITIGVKYTGFSGAQAFSKALFELTRRLIIFRAERERRFVRTQTYLTAQLLQAVFGYLGDDERTFEIAEACRSSLVYNAKCMGILYKTSDTPEYEQTNSPPEESWHTWIRKERYRRLAWAIYELDTSSAYLHNNRPLLSPEDIKTLLPSSSRHWEAQSAHAWASLHPWATSCPPTTSLRGLIQTVVHGTEMGFQKIDDEKHRFLVVLSLVRTLWSVKDVHFSSIIGQDHDGFESALCNQQQEELLTTIDKLYDHPGLSSRFYTRSQLLQVVYRAQLTHIAHLFGAGDLLNFLYSYLRKGHKAAEVGRRMQQWADKDAHRVRRVAYHSAQLLGLMRKFPSNLPAEPFVVFHAGAVLSMMSTLLPSCSGSPETSSLQIDDLDGDEQQVKKAHIWVKHGGNVSIWMHGVSSLCCEQGRQEVLDQTAWLLNGMNVWPISKKFAAMTLSLRESSLYVTVARLPLPL